MAVTQKDIADALGVSTVTVSRALREHADLSEQTKRKVMETAERLGYLKHRAARPAIRRVGVLAYGISRQFFFESTLVQGMFEAIQNRFREAGVEVVLQMPEPREVPTMVTEGSVDAVVIMGHADESIFKRLGNIYSVALAGATAQAAHAHIGSDDFGGEFAVAEYLISRGHRRIAFLGEDRPDSPVMRNRAHGYTLAMFDNKLQPNLHWISTNADPRTEQMQPQIAAFLQKNPDITALVASHDGIAHRAQLACRQLGIDVPDQISIVGYDDMPVSREGQLTTYRPEWSAIGNLAAELILKQVAGPSQGYRMVVPGRIVHRESVATLKPE